MSNPTPGPWTFEEDGGTDGEPVIRGADGNIVAVVYPHQGPDYREPLEAFEANAALFVTAPDLLRERDEYKAQRDVLRDALKRIVDAAHEPGSLSDDPEIDRFCCVWEGFIAHGRTVLEQIANTEGGE